MAVFIRAAIVVGLLSAATPVHAGEGEFDLRGDAGGVSFHFRANTIYPGCLQGALTNSNAFEVRVTFQVEATSWGGTVWRTAAPDKDWQTTWLLAPGVAVDGYVNIGWCPFNLTVGTPAVTVATEKVRAMRILDFQVVRTATDQPPEPTPAPAPAPAPTPAATPEPTPAPAPSPGSSGGGRSGGGGHGGAGGGHRGGVGGGGGPRPGVRVAGRAPAGARTGAMPRGGGVDRKSAAVAAAVAGGVVVAGALAMFGVKPGRRTFEIVVAAPLGSAGFEHTAYGSSAGFAYGGSAELRAFLWGNPPASPAARHYGLEIAARGRLWHRGIGDQSPVTSLTHYAVEPQLRLWLGWLGLGLFGGTQWSSFALAAPDATGAMTSVDHRYVTGAEVTLALLPAFRPANIELSGRWGTVFADGAEPAFAFGTSDLIGGRLRMGANLLYIDLEGTWLRNLPGTLRAERFWGVTAGLRVSLGTSVQKQDVR